MVKVLIGNLFDSKAQTLVNTVNCVGVMGKGIALEFKERFPDMHEDYVRRCKAGEVRLGRPYLYARLSPPWILNFPTKDHWRSVSRLQDIVSGLEHLDLHHKEWGITSLAVPPLGCGHGQLEWRVVGPTLYRHLKRLEIPVELFAPFGTPHDELRPEFLEGSSLDQSASEPEYRVEPGLVALVEILAHIEREPYHWTVGRTTFQKIAYFATESGIPTRLRYQRGSYGPFSPDLKAAEARLVNNGVVTEQRLGRMFAVRVGPTYGDAERAYATRLREWSAVIEKLADLFLRMRTDDAEIAATVHFASKELSRKGGARPTEMDVLRAVMAWKQKRRPPLKETDVARGIRNLGAHGWIDAAPSPELPVEQDELIDV